MSKYIDAEKLIAKLRKHLMPTVLDREYDEWEHGKDSGLHQAIGIIESLQQEQPECSSSLADFESTSADIKLRTCDKIEMEKLYGEEY